MSPDQELRDELLKLRLILVRRVREALESDKVMSPSYLDVARRLLSDQLEEAPRPPVRPVVGDLPFAPPDEP